MTAPLTNRLVTIFGGSGFIGRHLVRALAHEGWRIRVAVRRPNVAHFLRPAGRVGQIQLLKTNVRDDAQVAEAIAGADAVINLVAIMKQSGGQRFDALHAEAAERIARLARQAGADRLIHFSALGVGDETTSRYYRTKAEGEALVRQEFPAATIVRPAVVFGQEDQLFNRFAALMRMFPLFPVIGGGHTRFQPVFVGDVAEGVAALLRDGNTAGRVFEFAGPEEMTLKEMIQLVAHETDRKRALIPLPFAIAKVLGAVAQFVPGAPITYDEVLTLQSDSVASGTLPDLRSLGITPTASEAILPSYIWRFRPRGQFTPAPG
jgi:uncharacterized protein YbjT (DUF2867 family)